MALLDTNVIRQDFLILGRTVRNGKKLVYLDRLPQAKNL